MQISKNKSMEIELNDATDEPLSLKHFTNCFNQNKDEKKKQLSGSHCSD